MLKTNEVKCYISYTVLFISSSFPEKASGGHILPSFTLVASQQLSQ